MTKIVNESVNESVNKSKKTISKSDWEKIKNEKNINDFNIIDDQEINSTEDNNKNKDNDLGKNLPESDKATTDFPLLDFIKQSYSQSLSYGAVESCRAMLRDGGNSLLGFLESMENFLDDSKHDAKREEFREENAIGVEKWKIQNEEQNLRESKFNNEHNEYNEDKVTNSQQEQVIVQLEQDRNKNKPNTANIVENKNNQPDKELGGNVGKLRDGRDAVPTIEKKDRSKENQPKENEPKKSSWRENVASGVAAFVTGAAVVAAVATCIAFPVVAGVAGVAGGFAMLNGADPTAPAQLLYHGVKGAINGMMGGEKQIETGGGEEKAAKVAEAVKGGGKGSVEDTKKQEQPIEQVENISQTEVINSKEIAENKNNVEEQQTINKTNTGDDVSINQKTKGENNTKVDDETKWQNFVKERESENSRSTQLG